MTMCDVLRLSFFWCRLLGECGILCVPNVGMQLIRTASMALGGACVVTNVASMTPDRDVRSSHVNRMTF